MSSSLVWLRPLRLLTKSITVGMRRAISAASCKVRSAAGRLSCYLVARLFRQGDQVFVEGDGLCAPQALPLDGDAFLGGDAGRRLLRGVEHAREHGRVERALVEGHLAPSVERGDDGGADVDEPVVARTSSRAAHRP